MSLSVSLSGLSKSFAARPALKGISCEFGAGKVNVVLGPNGSGKTTLLRIVAGLESPDGGSIAYTGGGGIVPAGNTLMRRMTLVSQWPVLFDTTLFKNVAFGLRLRGLPPGVVSERVDEAIEAGGLGRLAHARARTLSAGESQRAAFVRAYALRPELLLLDEPTANLDPDGVALIERLILRMKEDYGTTSVLVTHNIFQARRLADTAFLMFGGEMVESGPASGFFGSPARELTRKFLSGEVVY